MSFFFFFSTKNEEIPEQIQNPVTKNICFSHTYLADNKNPEFDVLITNVCRVDGNVPVMFQYPNRMLLRA